MYTWASDCICIDTEGLCMQWNNFSFRPEGHGPSKTYSKLPKTLVKMTPSQIQPTLPD